MEKRNSAKKLIVFSGGGTGGPSIVPLALAKAYYAIDTTVKFVFIGSNPILEKKLFAELFQSLSIDYYSIPAGKWRRYFSFKNFFDLFKIIYSFFKSLALLIRLKPKLIVSAGSFASVPLVWAGKVLGIRVMVHQQDLRAGLANRLMAPFADVLTVAFEKSLGDYGDRAFWLGNPRLDYGSEGQAEIDDDRVSFNRPLILLSGGGGGSSALNTLLIEALPNLPSDWQVVHQTGRGKGKPGFRRDNYLAVENFSHSRFVAYARKADIIISRAGLGALTEFSALAKALIVVPMPNSHQEDNARYFADKEAVIYLEQKALTGKVLAEEILSLWGDEKKRKNLSLAISQIMPQKAASQGAVIIQKILYEST